MISIFKKALSIILAAIVLFVIGLIGHSDMVIEQEDAIITQQIINSGRYK